ncbi:MAG: YfcE family phosphodiesterase [Acholeplasmataceae bacterium]
MTLLLTSDVHGDIGRLKRLVAKFADADLHVDAGDLCSRNQAFHHPFTTVKGNNDFGSSEPLMRLIEIGGLRVMVTHGHVERVKFGLERLLDKAKAQQADVCIFGHTHRRYLDRRDGILFINPGSLGGPDHSYAIYEDGQVRFDRMNDGS